MSDVFVSYSRRDSEFVGRLTDSMVARGKEVWLDTEGIADGEVFPEAIKRAIESSDAFLFVITPESVRSPYCENEVEHAREMQKRILPVLRGHVADSALPAEIRDRNWIPLTEQDDFDSGVARLIAALDSDLEATKAHTHWLVKALEWDTAKRDKSFLLRGSELKAAEGWLAAIPQDAEPAPTSLQREYVLASRTAAARRERALLAISVGVAIVSIGLLVFALISRGQAVSERVAARSQALAAESQAQLPNDPEISLILGMRAVETKATAQSMFALRAALDASPLERGFATVKVPGACGTQQPGLTAAYSPDGRQIAEADCNGTVRLLNPAIGRVERTVRVGGASSVAYSPDGSSVAVGSGLAVTLLDPRTGKVLRRLALPVLPGGHPAQILDVAFSPSGGMLAASSPAGVAVWAIPGGRSRMLARTPAQGTSVTFSPDGRRLYTAGFDGLVRVFDVATGRELRQLDPFPMNRGQAAWPPVVAASHDGRRLAVAYPTGASGIGVVSVYSTSTWRKEFDVTSIPEVQIQSLAFSPDDTRLAIGAEDGTAGVWSLIGREQLAAYAGPTASVNSVSFTPDGNSVLTASNDGVTRIWRALGAERSFLAVGASIEGVALDGDRLEVLQEGPATGWSLTGYKLPGGQPLHRVQLLPRASAGFASLSADGRYAFVGRLAPGVNPAIAPSALTVVDAATDRVVHRLGTAVLDLVAPPEFSPDDSKVIFLETPNARQIVGPGGSGVGLTGRARLVVLTLASGHTVTLPNPEPCGPGTGARWAFSGDGGRVAQEAFCGIVDVWDANTGRLVRQLDQGAETSAVALNHDGSRVLVSSWDSRARIWSVATGQPLVNFIGHTRGIADAALSPDGTRVLTSSLDHTVRVWDARTGQVLRVLSFPDDQSPVTFSTDGSQIAVGENTPIFDVPNIVRVFDTCPACDNPAELLRLAAPHVTTHLTTLERTVVNGA